MHAIRGGRRGTVLLARSSGGRGRTYRNSICSCMSGSAWRWGLGKSCSTERHLPLTFLLPNCHAPILYECVIVANVPISPSHLRTAHLQQSEQPASVPGAARLCATRIHGRGGAGWGRPLGKNRWQLGMAFCGRTEGSGGADRMVEDRMVEEDCMWGGGWGSDEVSLH